MQSENPLIADIAKLLNSAAGTVAGMGREARDAARERMKEGLGGLDFVSREEFDTVKLMAAKAREENEALKARISEIWQQRSDRYSQIRCDATVKPRKKIEMSYIGG